MQVLYQLSYGPIDACVAPQRGPDGVIKAYTATGRHTATSRPCTLTCSAGSTIGS